MFPESYTRTDQIFVSYSRQDKDFVDKLVDKLRRRGVRVWLDRTDIVASTNWKQAIETAIKADSAAVLAVLSPDSVSSEWVGIEIDAALDHNIPVIPYIYRECELPARLRAYQSIHDSDPDAFEKLRKALPARALIQNSKIANEGILRRNDMTFEQAAALVDFPLRLTAKLDAVSIPLIGLPLIPTTYCTTYLIGRAADTLEWHPRTQLGLQFGQAFPGSEFPVRIALHMFKEHGPDYPLRLLLVRGPLQIRLDRRSNSYSLSYGLDDEAPAEWEDAVQAAVSLLNLYHEIGQSTRPEPQLFALAPIALMYQLGAVMDRGFYRTEVYHYMIGESRYVRIFGNLNP